MSNAQNTYLSSSTSRLLLFVIFYLPFQSYLPSTSIFMGINLLNILILCLIVVINKEEVYYKYANYIKFKTIIIVLMLYTFLSAVVNCSNSGIVESLITWKRFYSIPILFIIAYNLIKNEKQIKTVTGIVSFVTFVSAIQVLRNTSEFSDAHYNDGMRYGGMFGPGGENDLAAFLAINFFWFIFWGQEAGKRWQKLLFFSMAGIVAMACLYCFSRGAYISLMVGILYYGWRRYRQMLVLLIVMLFTIPVWAPKPINDRVDMLTKEDQREADASAANRLIIWEGSRKMIADNFLFGVGPGNFGANIRKYASLPENGPRASHNMYYRMGAELGIPGLLLFLLILWSFFKEGVMLSRETSGWQATWATAFTASIICLIISNYFGDRFAREELTGYIWLCAAIAYRLRANIKAQTYQATLSQCS